MSHHFDFEPRVQEALWLKSHYSIHAGIDVSDGLSLDLWRLTEASRCGAFVDLATIPIAPDAEIHARQCNDGSSALDHVLADGEDFELILAVLPDAADELLERQPLDCGLTCIGQFVAENGLWCHDAAGARRPLAPRGFEHRLDA